MSEIDALFDRIAATLADEVPAAAVVGGLVAEAETALAQARDMAERARWVALHPQTSAGATVIARRNVDEQSFAAERLAVALSELKVKHKVAFDREERAEHEALVAEVTAERDALAAELQEAYPRLAGELADLLARVRANDERARSLRIESVETVARGISAHGVIGNTPAARLVDAVYLPAWDPYGFTMGLQIWPPLSRSMTVAVSPEMAAAAAARGAEMRAIGDAVAARRREEADSPRRKIT